LVIGDYFMVPAAIDISKGVRALFADRGLFGEETERIIRNRLD